MTIDLLQILSPKTNTHKSLVEYLVTGLSIYFKQTYVSVEGEVTSVSEGQRLGDEEIKG